MKLKAYTVSTNRHVNRAISEAIGEASHVRQGHVTVVATTKKAAAEYATSCGINTRAADPELRLAGSDYGNDLVAFTEALDVTAAVYVKPCLSRDGNPVVRVEPGDQITPVGTARYGTLTTPRFETS